jgi:hypothetical protein
MSRASVRVGEEKPHQPANRLDRTGTRRDARRGETSLTRSQKWGARGCVPADHTQLARCKLHRVTAGPGARGQGRRVGWAEWTLLAFVCRCAFGFGLLRHQSGTALSY